MDLDTHPDDYALKEPTHVVDEAILVRIEGTSNEKTTAADVASFRTFAIAATDNAAFQVLAQDKKRHKAIIMVHNALGAAVPAIPPYVYIGQQAQSGANGDARGAAIVAGDLFPYESAGALWLVPAGVACSVSIIEERYV